MDHIKQSMDKSSFVNVHLDIWLYNIIIKEICFYIKHQEMRLCWMQVVCLPLHLPTFWYYCQLSPTCNWSNVIQHGFIHFFFASGEKPTSTCNPRIWGEITKTFNSSLSLHLSPLSNNVQVSRWITSKATHLPRSLGQTWSLAQAPHLLKELQLQNHVPWTRYCNCRLCCLLHLRTFLPQQQEEPSLNYWILLFPH